MLRERCEGLTILTTSREALGLPGERVLEVGPLDIDDAVEVFLLRAADQIGDTASASLDRRVLTDLCARLDRLPLAIELAAARLRSMALSELAVVSVWVGPPQWPAPSRRAPDPGCHDPLVVRPTDRAEQLLFSCLSVFAGTFDLEAAERVR